MKKKPFKDWVLDNFFPVAIFVFSAAVILFSIVFILSFCGSVLGVLFGI